MKKTALVLIILSSIFLWSSHASAQVSVTVAVAPPEIPVYVQPDCPYDGYIWSPGYWAYGSSDGYYWVPGVWVAPPSVGVLWTPGYWGFYGGYYRWHRGYWGPHIGYYGGINYGYGYWGHGYEGGRWEGGHFRYNTAVSHVNTRIVHNTYVDRAGVRSGGSRAAFNGPGGVRERPSAGDRLAARDKHISPTSVQRSHIQAARKDPATHYKVNKGNPGTRTAMSSPAHAANNHTAAHGGNVNRTTSHQNAAGTRQHSQGTPRQNTQRAAQHNQASRMQQQRQAPQQRQQAPRMQQQRQAPQQRQMPQQRPGGGGMGRSPQPRQAPQQRSPGGNGGENRGGGGRR